MLLIPGQGESINHAVTSDTQDQVPAFWSTEELCQQPAGDHRRLPCRKSGASTSGQEISSARATQFAADHRRAFGHTHVQDIIGGCVRQQCNKETTQNPACFMKESRMGRTKGESSLLTAAVPLKVWPLLRITRMTLLALQSAATAHWPSTVAKSHSCSRPCTHAL